MARVNVATGFIAKLFGSADGRDSVRALYAAIVGEARQPEWYLKGGVEDSVSGRYEALAMVFSLIAIRLEALGGEAETASVMLTECFVEDIEGQLRQDGVGDVMVGKRVGTLVGGLGGRIGAYREGLQNEAMLDDALIRNLYRGALPEPAALGFVRDRFAALHARFQTLGLDPLLSGRL